MNLHFKRQVRCPVELCSMTSVRCGACTSHQRRYVQHKTCAHKEGAACISAERRTTEKRTDGVGGRGDGVPRRDTTVRVRERLCASAKDVNII